MIKISVKHNIDQVVKTLDTIQRKQIPFAISRTLNDTAFKIKAAEEREVRDVFDRPTPRTQKAFYVKRSTKQKLVAEIGIEEFGGKGVAPSKYLLAQIVGGSRRPKRFEVALMRAGVMPASHRAVPGAAAKMDAYGNMQGGQIVQILSYFRAFPEAGYKANITDKRKAALRKGSKRKVGFEYFVGSPGDGRLPLGIWQRFRFAGSTAIKPVLIFVASATYEAVFDFEYVARNTVSKEFDKIFTQRMAEALATAK